MIFRGQQATVGDGLAVARSRFSQIAGWAALSTAIGLMLSALENQGGIAARSLGRVLVVGWSLITFLAVPVIAIEGTGPFETLKRSSSLFSRAGASRSPATSRSAAPSSSSGCCRASSLIVAGVLIWSSASFVGALLVISA